MVWGFVLLGTGWANNFSTLITLRVLLGALEAPIVPGNFLVIGMWYSRRYLRLSEPKKGANITTESNQSGQD